MNWTLLYGCELGKFSLGPRLWIYNLNALWWWVDQTEWAKRLGSNYWLEISKMILGFFLRPFDSRFFVDFIGLTLFFEILMTMYETIFQRHCYGVGPVLGEDCAMRYLTTLPPVAMINTFFIYLNKFYFWSVNVYGSYHKIQFTDHIA